MKLRLVYPRITGGTPVTKAEHDQQRDRVEASTRLSDRRSERRDEASTQARLRPRSGQVGNVVPIRSRRSRDTTGPEAA